MKRVVTFGEIMLRLSPEGYGRFARADRLDMFFGGAEANVAVALCQMGMEAAFVTKLPEHAVAQAAVNALRGYGVDISGVLRGSGRMGIYFLEKGASQRAGSVIYDRAGSAFSEARPEEFDWDDILEGADWFHFTGITPALGDRMAEACAQACKTAKAKGVRVSLDLNYRERLWSREKAGEVMAGLAPYADLCIGNKGSAADLFGIRAGDGAYGGEIDHEADLKAARMISERLGIKTVAFTIRQTISASDNNWSAVLYDAGKEYRAGTYEMRVVDRVGGGDAFAAGLIYALAAQMGGREAIEFAAAAGCLKHSMEGDFLLAGAGEVETLARGDGTGSVRR